MRVVGEATLASTSAHGAVLDVAGGHRLVITALEEDMIRVRLDRLAARSLTRTWMVSPGDIGSSPCEGRDKEAVDGFSMPAASVEVIQADSVLQVSTSRLRVIVPLGVSPLALRWEWKDLAKGGEWAPLMQDRRTGAYYFGRHDARLSHHVKRGRGDRFFGLGEKSGGVDKAGRRYRMDCHDALGYDAELSDPLYKFWPFYIAKPADLSSAAYGLLYDNHATCAMDLGGAFDNYHGYFASYEATCGDMDYTVILGPAVLQVTRRFAWLIGGTAMPPLWSLGYSGSTMSYTDAPNAQEQMAQFLRLCSTHRIPCSSFQMSSGYTSIKGKRYVFNWNTAKFPDPKAFAASYAAAGIRLAANIKPCLLTDHPLYEHCEREGLFLLDSEEAAGTRPETCMFWDAVGSHLDFTNPATAAWWSAQVKEKLLDVGIECTWNDNNEWHVDDECAICHGFGSPTELRLVRPVQSLLMVRSSHVAQAAHSPESRLWLISRSAMPGVQRYAQTWTGDNYTSWHTLKWNIPMGIGLSLSGFFNVGHDVGGFAGPPPEPELLVRWVQNGCFHPRFTIHSWNDNGTPNEPWMFPEVTHLVREAICNRYAFLPYLYHLLRRAATEHEPILRPTFLDHEHDPTAWEANNDFLLGDALLVASVVERGARTRDIYLPDNLGKGWWDWHKGKWYEGGQLITLDAPLERCPLLARGGCMIMRAAPTAAAADASKPQERTLHVFGTPPAMGETYSQLVWIEDDGVSAKSDAQRLVISCDLVCTAAEIKLDVRATFHGSWRPSFDTVAVRKPSGEVRPVHIVLESVGANLQFDVCGVEFVGEKFGRGD